MKIIKNIKTGSVLMTAFLAINLYAQEYPTESIRLVVPYSAGGLTDNLARLVGKELERRLGKPVIIENKIGAGGNIAMELVAKSKPDGHTLIFAGPAQASINEILYPNIKYSTLRDFKPITTVANFSLVMLVNNESGISKINDFNSNKKKDLYYGTAGNATTGHLVSEMLRKNFSSNLIHVPFKGESPALVELMAGRIDYVFSTITTANPLIDGKKLKAIAVTSKERSELLPNVPSVSEDFQKGFNVFGWYALLAPVGVENKIIEKIYRALNDMKKDKAYSDSISSRGLSSSFYSTEELNNMIGVEKTKWEKIIREANIKVD